MAFAVGVNNDNVIVGAVTENPVVEILLALGVRIEKGVPRLAVPSPLPLSSRSSASSRFLDSSRPARARDSISFS